MKRRELLSNLVFASMAAGASSLAAPSRAFAAACNPVPDMNRTLVNVMLNGGADTRFMFMPVPLTCDHEDLLYSARRNMYASSRSTPGMTFAEMFALEYVVPDGENFGIHKSCGWLLDQYELGNVAIIANAYCSRNRRHDQSIHNANVGEPNLDEYNLERDGWGGRLVEYIDPGARSVELGGSISVFNKGTLDGNRLAQVIHAQNTRDIALPDVDPVTGGGGGNKDAVTRALKHYYQARGEEVLAEKPNDWPYHPFYDHNAVFRAFGGQITERLLECGAVPESLLTMGLNSGSFSQQCRNLYDLCLAPDIFGTRTVSMSYGGWDTHNNQEGRISGNLGDILGNGGGLETATQEIAALGSNAIDQLVFYFASDFGRQIVTNGDFGTDHGRGTYTVVQGLGVNGGVYGDMFPASEAVESNGKIPLETHGADILGETSTENILAEVCEWVAPGSSSSVFPGMSASNVESPGLLNNLMA